MIEIIFPVIIIIFLLVVVVIFWRDKKKLELRVQETDERLNQSDDRFEQAETRLKALRDYARRVNLIDYKYVDVVVFGPRESGKTSICELWTSPWTQISEIQASYTWRTYEANIFEFEPVTKKSELFDVERTHKPTLRVRVRDYPGEDEFRVKAVEAIRDMEDKAVILFIFRVDYENGEITDTNLNAEYYSRVFIEEIEHHIPRIAGSIAKAFVVFNKIDKLPRDWSDKEIRDKLLEANEDSLYEISRIFSGLLDDYYLTSAATNRNIINLLGQVGKIAVPEEKHEEYDQAIQVLEREFEMLGHS